MLVERARVEMPPSLMSRGWGNMHRKRRQHALRSRQASCEVREPQPLQLGTTRQCACLS